MEQSKQHEKRIVEENAKLMGFGNVIHGLHGHNWASEKTTTKKVTTTKAVTTLSTNATTTLAITEAPEEESSENDVRKRREDEETETEEPETVEAENETEEENKEENEEEEAKETTEPKEKPKPKPKKPVKITSDTKHRSKVPKPTLSPEEEKKKEEAKQELAKQAEENKVLFEKYQKWRIEYMANKMEYNYGNETTHSKFTMGGNKEGQPYHCYTLR